MWAIKVAKYVLYVSLIAFDDQTIDTQDSRCVNLDPSKGNIIFIQEKKWKQGLGVRVCRRRDHIISNPSTPSPKQEH